MKKIIIILMLLVCGCSNKLVCEYENYYEDIKISNKIEFDFNKNKYTEINKMIFKDNVTASLYYKEISDYKDEFNLKLVDNKIVSKLEDNFSETKKELKERYKGYDYTCN